VAVSSRAVWLGVAFFSFGLGGQASLCHAQDLQLGIVALENSTDPEKLPVPGAPSPGVSEAQAQAHPQRGPALLRFGIATGLIGGLGTLAYLDRNGGGGRAIAIGSASVVSGALGTMLVLAASKGGDTRGMGGALLSVPVGLLSAVGGGLLAAHLSQDPGGPRFATAVVPLGVAWLTGLAFTIDAW